MSARGAAGPFYGALTTTYATTNGFNIARNALPAGPESDGARRFAITGKGGVDFTPYFNVEGFVRHSRRRADSDPQDPNFLNTGLVEDRAGDTTAINDTLARGEATLKLFEDRWIQSAKWTSLAPGIGCDRSLRAQLRVVGVGGDVHLQERIAAQLDDRRRREAPVDRAGREPQRTLQLRQHLPVRAGSRGRARTAIGAARPVSAANTFSSCCAPARRCRRRCGRTSTSRSRTSSPGAIRSRSRSRRSAGGCMRASAAPSPIRASSSSSASSPAPSSPNPGLVPESSVGWDVGWEQTFFDGRAVVDVTYFNSRLQNEIVTIFLPTLPQLGAQSRRRFDARRGRGRRQGQPDRLADAGGDLHLHRCARRQGRAGNPPPASRGVRHRDRPVRRRRGKAIVNVVYNGKMPDTVFKFPTESVILNAYTLVAGQISYDTTPWSNDLHTRRKRVQSALRGGVLVSLARRRGLCRAEDPLELSGPFRSGRRRPPHCGGARCGGWFVQTCEKR